MYNNISCVCVYFLYDIPRNLIVSHFGPIYLNNHATDLAHTNLKVLLNSVMKIGLTARKLC